MKLKKMTHRNLSLDILIGVTVICLPMLVQYFLHDYGIIVAVGMGFCWMRDILYDIHLRTLFPQCRLTPAKFDVAIKRKR
jgi:hypothetical protein